MTTTSTAAHHHPFHGIAVGDKVLARVIQLRAGQGVDAKKEDGRKKTASLSDQGEGENSAIAVYLSMEGLPQPHQQQQAENNPESSASSSSSSSSSASNKRKRAESVDSVTGLGQGQTGGGEGGGKWTPMVQLWGKNAVGINTVHAAVITAISSEGSPSSSAPSSSSSAASSSGSPLRRDVTGCIVALSPYIRLLTIPANTPPSPSYTSHLTIDYCLSFLSPLLHLSLAQRSSALSGRIEGPRGGESLPRELLRGTTHTRRRHW